jgi:hypothetical protein
MTTPNGERPSPESMPAEIDRLRMLRESIAKELPVLIARDQLRKAAREDRSISGAVRDAIHRSDLPLQAIATKAGLSPVEVDEFLTGERTLRSDILDRLAAVIGYEIPTARAGA